MVKVRPDPLKGKPLTREMLTPELLDAVFGTAEESAARTLVFKANMRRANHARAEFPGEYIAVVECNVVAHSPDRDAIFEHLERLGLLAAEGLGIARPIRPNQ